MSFFIRRWPRSSSAYSLVVLLLWSLANKDGCEQYHFPIRKCNLKLHSSLSRSIYYLTDSQRLKNNRLPSEQTLTENHCFLKAYLGPKIIKCVLIFKRFFLVKQLEPLVCKCNFFVLFSNAVRFWKEEFGQNFFTREKKLMSADPSSFSG